MARSLFERERADLARHAPSTGTHLAHASAAKEVRGLRPAETVSRKAAEAGKGGVERLEARQRVLLRGQRAAARPETAAEEKARQKIQAAARGRAGRKRAEVQKVEASLLSVSEGKLLSAREVQALRKRAKVGGAPPPSATRSDGTPPRRTPASAAERARLLSALEHRRLQQVGAAETHRSAEGGLRGLRVEPLPLPPPPPREVDVAPPSDWAAYYSWRGQPSPDRPPWLSSPSGKWGSGVGAGSPRPKSAPRPRSPGRTDGAAWTDRQQQRRLDALRACASPDAQECSFPQAGWVTEEARQLEREFTAVSPTKATASVPAKVAAATAAAAARVAAAAAAAAAPVRAVTSPAKAVTSPAKAAAAANATRGAPLPSKVADGLLPLSHELEALGEDAMGARHAEGKLLSARKVQALRSAAEAEEARQLEREIALPRSPQRHVAVRSLPAKVANGLALLSHELEALREAARLARLARVHGPNRLFLVDLL